MFCLTCGDSVTISTVLAAFALAVLSAGHTLLEALAVLLLAAGPPAVAALVVFEGGRSPEISQVFARRPIVLPLLELGAESHGIPQQYGLHSFGSQDLVLLRVSVLAALAPALGSTDALVLEALAVKLQAARVAAVAVLRSIVSGLAILLGVAIGALYCLDTVSQAILSLVFLGLCLHHPLCLVRASDVLAVGLSGRLGLGTESRRALLPQFSLLLVDHHL